MKPYSSHSVILAAVIFCVICLLTTVSHATVHVKGLIQNDTFYTTSSPYIVDSSIRVGYLVIQPGVEVRFAGHGSEFRIEGVIICNGTATDSVRFTRDSDTSSFDGLVFQSSTPGSQISYTIVEFASSSGIEIWDSWPSIHNCSIRNNISPDNGGGIKISNSSSDTLRFTSCTFANNSCSQINGIPRGGGIYVSSGLVDCVLCYFVGNQAHVYTTYGNVTQYCAGAAFFLGFGDARFYNCYFDANHAVVHPAPYSGCSGYGGAVYINNSSCHADFFNCIIVNNTANNLGGGIYTNSEFTRCFNGTLSDNNNFAIYSTSTNTAVPIKVINTILFYNSSSSGAQVSGIFDISYSDVQGGYSGVGNFSYSPVFRGGTDLCKYLITYPPSSCVDAGSPDSAYSDSCYSFSYNTPRCDVGAGGAKGGCLWTEPSSFLLPCGRVVPLKLLYFLATKERQSNQLLWTTSDELNVSHFQVERSNDGREFIKVGTVHAGLSRYSFTDRTPPLSKNYYRLKMVDVDEKFSYSPVKLVDNSSNFLMSAYPNPFADVLTIELPASEKGGVLQLFSPEGELVYEKRHVNPTNSPIVLRNLPKLRGMYILKFAGEKTYVLRLFTNGF